MTQQQFQIIKMYPPQYLLILKNSSQIIPNTSEENNSPCFEHNLNINF